MLVVGIIIVDVVGVVVYVVALAHLAGMHFLVEQVEERIIVLEPVRSYELLHVCGTI